MDNILIKNGQLRQKPLGDLVSIHIDKGFIAGFGEKLSAKDSKEIDAQGNLVTESFVNPHLHLDKVYTLDRMDELALKSYQVEGMGKAMNAIELASHVKEDYDQSWIIENVRRELQHATQNGNTHIRAFADVDSKAKLEGVKALIQAKKEFKGKVDLQIVAFPQDGVVREGGAAKLVREAMKLGADVVGGIPWIEFTDASA